MPFDHPRLTIIVSVTKTFLSKNGERVRVPRLWAVGTHPCGALSNPCINGEHDGGIFATVIRGGMAIGQVRYRSLKERLPKKKEEIQ